jgi:spore photoproduct lyase
VHDGWLEQWAELFDQIDAATNAAAKRQLACEIIFLTHNEALHEVNLGWHPRGEDLLWRPDLQQVKRSQSGQWNVRYRTGAKGRYVAQLTELLAEKLPYCTVRYAF